MDGRLMSSDNLMTCDLLATCESVATPFVGLKISQFASQLQLCKLRFATAIVS